VGDLRYILDANAFIEAYRRYYAFDLCPGFWDSIEHYGVESVLASIDKVGDELRSEDRLGEWQAEAPEALFLPTDEDDVLEAFREVIQWAYQQARFTTEAKHAFANDTDAWLVAYARAKGLTVVTHEKPEPESRRSVKIPDVCREFGIPYRNTFEMLRELEVSFHWNPPSPAN